MAYSLDEIAKSISFNSYSDFTQSEYWENRKIKLAAVYPKKCFCCNSFDKIVCHHITYARLGKELDADLVWVCVKCHNNIHYCVQNNYADLRIAHEVVREAIKNSFEGKFAVYKSNRCVFGKKKKPKKRYKKKKDFFVISDREIESKPSEDTGYLSKNQYDNLVLKRIRPEVARKITSDQYPQIWKWLKVYSAEGYNVWPLTLEAIIEKSR